jgi:hypothetical protein
MESVCLSGRCSVLLDVLTLLQIKEHSARIYHIVNQYHQEMTPGSLQSYPGGLQASMQEFTEALHRSCATTEALNNCHQVFQDLSQKELAEQNAHKMNPRHGSEYGTDDGQSYADETRSNSSQQPEKKMRRGVSGLVCNPSFVFQLTCL